MADNREILRRGFEDPVWFARTFLEEQFPTPIPWFHRGLFAILTRQCNFLLRYGEIDKIIEHFTYTGSDGQVKPVFAFQNGELVMYRRRYTLVMIPRGFSKTTIAGQAVPIRDIVYRVCPFSVYVSEAGPHAKMQLENVKYELSNNEKLLSVFGEQKPQMSADQRWAADFFETVHGCAWAARGRGAQIRGMNHHGRRPSKIIVDDYEDKESVATQDQREKTRKTFYGDLKPALPRQDPNASIVYLATLLHSDALPTYLARDPEWSVVNFGARLPNGELLWPEWMDEAAIDLEKRSYANAGMLHVFYLEYFNDAKPEETQKFRREFIHYGPVDGNIVGTAIYIDPAISKKTSADECVILAVSMTDKGRFFVRDGWGKRGATVREMIDKYFEFSRLYQATKHGVESNAFQAALVHVMREEMFRKKQYFEITPVTHSTKKSERILGILQPRYANGYIFHTQTFHSLETQLMDFKPDVDEQPDDWPDGLAGAIALLDPYAAAGAEEDPESDESYDDETEMDLAEAWYH